MIKELSPDFELIDFFPGFSEWWRRIKNLPIQDQISAWKDEWMSPWPELLQKQIECYSTDGLDWREVAAKHVFPDLGSRFSDMEVAHDHLLDICPAVCSKISGQGFFSSPRDSSGNTHTKIFLIIYVGIGCGAGWATTYQQHPAVLFGLENIAECNWTDPQALEGLIAHEVGHLLHTEFRSRAGLGEGNGAWWSLYSEGFAQRCEHIFLERENFHMQHHGTENDWLNWCRAHRAELARQFLELADSHQSVTLFFGSWYNIDGHSQCGYFLGHEIIRSLERNMTLAGIAVLEDFVSVIRKGLIEIIKGS